MVRNGAPISEEVSQARNEAIRRMGEAYGRAVAEVAAGLAALGEATRRTGHSFTSLCRAGEVAGRPAVHAFTPDLDLRCTVRGCGLGPEEHDLW